MPELVIRPSPPTAMRGFVSSLLLLGHLRCQLFDVEILQLLEWAFQIQKRHNDLVQGHADSSMLAHPEAVTCCTNLVTGFDLEAANTRLERALLVHFGEETVVVDESLDALSLEQLLELAGARLECASRLARLDRDRGRRLGLRFLHLRH